METVLTIGDTIPPKNAIALLAFVMFSAVLFVVGFAYNHEKPGYFLAGIASLLFAILLTLLSSPI